MPIPEGYIFLRARSSMNETLIKISYKESFNMFQKLQYYIIFSDYSAVKLEMNIKK